MAEPVDQPAPLTVHDADGNPINLELHAKVVCWRVKLLPPPRSRGGAPELLYSPETGAPLVVATTATLDELRAQVARAGGRSGKLRLEALDERGAHIDGVPLGYVLLRLDANDDDQQDESAPITALTTLVNKLLEQNQQLARAHADTSIRLAAQNEALVSKVAAILDSAGRIVAPPPPAPAPQVVVEMPPGQDGQQPPNKFYEEILPQFLQSIAPLVMQAGQKLVENWQAPPPANGVAPPNAPPGVA